MNFILPIIYTSIFIFLIWKIKFFDSEGLSKKSLPAVFILKIIFGLVLWAIYTYHYTYRSTSDAYRFFDDATIIYNSTKGNFLHFVRIVLGINSEAEELKPYFSQTSSWYRPYDYGLINDDRTLIRFNAIVLFFSFGYYHVHTVFMNFLALIGLVALYKTFIAFLPDRKIELFFAVFLFPTVLFWGSGVLKEGLILFSLGIFLYSFFRILKSRNSLLLNLAILSFSLFMLSIIKVYVLLCMIPAIISMIFIKLSGNNRIILKFSLTHIILIIAALNIHYIFPEYNVLEMLQIKQRDFYNVAQLWEAGSAINIGRLEPNLWSFIIHIPRALFTTFFRPHLLEANSLFLYAAALENMIVIILLIFYLFHLNKRAGEKALVILFCLSFVILLALLIGWTTPIMGAIVRYKLPLLPFVVFILLFISNKPGFVFRFEKWISII